MTRFGSQYQVGRATGRCAHTNVVLEPNTECIATLCERADDDGLDRLDFSLEAWEAGARPPGLFSYWKTTVPDPEKKQRLLVDDDVLMDLFDRLGEDDRPQRIAFRYVLGLILMRKRLLRPAGRSMDEAGREVTLLHRKGAEPDEAPAELINPELTEDDVRQITEQLGEVLNTDL